MSIDFTLEKYFAEYLKGISELSDGSKGHYLQAMRTISKFMINKGELQDSIYEIQDLQKLEEIRDKLFADPDFKDLDKRGHRMYSSGLNYFYDFTSGEGAADTTIEIETIDIPIPATNKMKKASSDQWVRSPIIKQQVIRMSGYTCEINAHHETFISRSTGHQYMEGHHIIPMKYQKDFANSLDVYANVISLCPVCHRLLHHGTTSEMIDSVRHIYHDRADRLAACGLDLSESEFEKYACGQVNNG